MLKFEVDKENYTIPESFKELLLKDYIEIQKLKSNGFLLHAEIISILTGLDLKVIRDMGEEFTSLIIPALSFLFTTKDTTTTIIDEDDRTLTIGGKLFKVHGMKKPSPGQWIDMEFFEKKGKELLDECKKRMEQDDEYKKLVQEERAKVDPFKYLTAEELFNKRLAEYEACFYKAAILIRPVDEVKYNGDEMLKRVEFFKEHLDTDIALSTQVFFSNVNRDTYENIQLFLQTRGLVELKMRELEIFFNAMDGSTKS